MRAKSSTAHRNPAEVHTFWGLLVCCGMGMLLLFAGVHYADIAVPPDFAYELLAQRKSGEWLTVYGQTFLSQTLPVTAALLCGLSSAGAIFLPLLYFLVGSSYLYMILSFFSLNGFQGLVCYWAMFWVPALISLAVLTDFGAKSLRVSAALFRVAFLRRDEPADSRRLLRDYLSALCWCMVISGGAVLSGFLFVRFF